MITQKTTAVTAAPAVEFDPNNYKPRLIIHALTRLLSEPKIFSLEELYRIGLILLKMEKKDLTLTSLLISKWDTLSMCGQNEDMIQAVADLCDDLVAQLPLPKELVHEQTLKEFFWLRLPELISEVFPPHRPAVVTV
jgi:hypothetical protein